MWRNKLISALLLSLVTFLGAQEDAGVDLPGAPVPGNEGVPPTQLFVETEPSGTFFRINGALQNTRAPALLSGVEPGELLLDFWKEGYSSAERKILLKPGEVQVVRITLQPLHTPVVFPGEKEILLNGKPMAATGTQFLLPHGRYTIERTGAGTEVKPVFPGENLWLLSALGLAATALGSGVATYGDLNAPWRPDLALSPPTMGLYALFLGDLGWFISLSLQKADFENHVKTRSAPVKFAPQPLDVLMAQGEKELAQGNFDQAEARFQSVLEFYPESSLAAEALFRLGRIHSILGLPDQAEILYTLILKEYPLSSIWDRTQKALADLAFQQKDWQKARFHLNKILYLDPLISREDVQAARDEISLRRGDSE